MEAIAGEECCAKQIQMKKLMESLLRDMAALSVRVKKLEDDRGFKLKARSEMFVPPKGESLD